jgi:hypothetical protein
MSRSVDPVAITGGQGGRQPGEQPGRIVEEALDKLSIELNIAPQPLDGRLRLANRIHELINPSSGATDLSEPTQV